MFALRRIVHLLMFGLGAFAALLSAPVPAHAAEGSDKAAASQARSPAADASPHGLAVRIAGRVVDEAGQPAAGVTVEASADRNETPTIADGDGAFMLDLGKDPPRQINVIATSADGRQAYHSLQDARPASPPIELTLRPPREIEVDVVDAQGEPISGASVSAVIYWNQQLAKVASDARGKALLRVPADAPLAHLLAKKDGAGFDYVTFVRPDLPPSHFAQPRGSLPSGDDGPFTLELDGAKPFVVHVVDEQGRPLPLVVVRLPAISRPKKPLLSLFGLREFSALTDDEGRARFNAVPQDNDVPLTCEADSTYMAWLAATNGSADRAADLTVTMTPRVRIAGRVTLADGQPAPSAEVSCTGAGYRGGSITESTHTDADGNYQFLAVPDRYYSILASLGSSVSASATRVVRRRESVRVDLKLQGGTRLHGRVTVGQRKRPLSQSWLSLYQDPGVAHDDLPEADRLPRLLGLPGKAEPRLCRSTYTDDDGNYEFLVGPGQYELIAPAQADSPKFVIAGEPDLEVDIHSGRPDRMRFRGRVVLEENPGSVVARAEVHGVPFGAPASAIATMSDNTGRFETERAPSKLVVYAQSQDRRLAGIITIGVDDEACEIPVLGTCVAYGRLFTVAGEILRERQIAYGVRIERPAIDPYYFGGTATSDDRGDFQLAGLVPGARYDVFTIEPGVEGLPPRRRKIATFQAAESGELDLGDVAVPE